MKRFTRNITLGFICALIALTLCACNADTTTPTTTGGASKATTSTVNVATPTKKSVNQTLSSGNYTVGIDIPAGTYNFKATAGGGNVSTSDVTIDEIMGIASKGSEYTPTYSNADLSNGIVLSISGVTLQITSKDASGVALKKRLQTITKVEQFSDGNYVAGKDFPAGTYNLTAIKGSGNVSDDDVSNLLDAIMGTENNGMNLQNYKNVDFESGTKLTISGVTISLTPSK